MSKQRPSEPTTRKPAIRNPRPPAGFEAAYWRRRLFKNTFTRGGRRTVLKGWCVKIQHLGRRRTFSLAASNRENAAREAWQIYQRIVASGGESAVNPLRQVNPPPSSVPPTTLPEREAAKDADYWKQRLLHRKYLEFLRPRAKKEFSVRIEHAGTSHCFLLGTPDEAEAAAKAVEIHETVTGQGWEAAKERFHREVTIAFRWTDNPVVWTYATLAVRKSKGPIRAALRPPGRSVEFGVAIIEPDEGIRFALAACANQQEGFRCNAMFANATEALTKIPGRRLHLVLANQLLPDRPGGLCLQEVQAHTPHLAGLLYSVHEDSDELFRATPGGAAGYLLKRTSPLRIFEPIAGSDGTLTREHLASRIREYFQKLFAGLPAGPPNLELAKLTPREQEIITLLSKGRVAKEIADTLEISIWTVHGHVKNIFEKLNVHTRTEAVVKYLQK